VHFTKVPLVNQPVDIAILGFGFMGATHASVYQLLPAAQVVAIVDPRTEETRAAVAVRQWEIPVFPDYASAAANCKFSAVDICLPTDLHRDIACRAFEDGRHVFCEKPIALRLDAAREMTAAAHKAKRQFMVGHCLRFWPEYAELKRLVDSGEQGRLLSLSMSRRTGRPGYTAGNWVD
jgi:predicted dehydrogenase